MNASKAKKEASEKKVFFHHKITHAKQFLFLFHYAMLVVVSSFFAHGKFVLLETVGV